MFYVQNKLMINHLSRKIMLYCYCSTCNHKCEIIIPIYFIFLIEFNDDDDDEHFVYLELEKENNC